jgi:gliding motility-associated-like protein
METRILMSGEAFLENRDNTFYHFTEFESYNEFYNLAFADANNDGDLDALDVGDVSPRLFDYKTSLSQVISISPPENIAVTSTANGQLISWDKPSDLSIPLQYNYALYRNDKLYISPHNTNLGFTSSRNLGNAGAGNTILLDLPEGDYTIILQAVDLSFHKSPYIEKSFTVDLFEASEEFEPLKGIDMLNINFGISFPTTNPRENTLVVGDLDGNGTLDILYGGYDYINDQDVGGLLINTDGNFEKVSFINSFGSFTGKSTLHDLDGDGDLDIIGSFDNQTKILLNDGNASFTELDHQLPDGGCYAVGDLDMDGYNDIILSTPPIVNIPNQSVVKGSETFWVRQVSNLEFDGETKILSIGNINSTLYIRDIKLNDIDLDGDVDLFLSGSYASNVFGVELKAENYILRNDGSGKFSDEDELFVNDDGYQDRGNIGAEFVDVNGDHITDIITSAEVSGLFIGSSDHTFTPSEVDLIKSYGEIVAGDFNGDGALDVFLPEEEDFNLLLNIGNGDFKNDFLDVLEDQSRKVLEGDYNNNGTLDLLIYYDVGLSISQVEIGKTYLYDNATPKKSPKSETPINLNASLDGNSVTLHWDHVLLPNDQTVTYNLSVVNEVGRAYVTSHSLEDGSRLLAASGNTSYSNEFLLPNMPDGSYTWKVQSIDNIYRGSSFSPEQSFLICTEFEKNILSVIVPDNIGTNAEVTFQQTSPLTNVTYQWDFGDGQLSDEISPTHKYASSGKYAVSLSVTNEVGCELIFIDEVEVEDIVPVNISRLVTPNSDEKNDFLFIENIERYPSSELKIFSDTGQLIYSTTGYQNDWYATNKAGDTVTQGVYLCVLKIDQFSTEIRQTFTVIK